MKLSISHTQRISRSETHINLQTSSFYKSINPSFRSNLAMSTSAFSKFGGACVVMVCGDESGVGKTSVCMGILCAAIRMGMPPESLAYIKPCTQCEDVQLLWKWCEAEGIEHQGIGPVLFRAGYTQECIDGLHGTPQDRLNKVEAAVREIAVNKRLVLVDGVGYPGVGSCVGTSNAQVAKHLGIPVVLVGRPGVGNAIDSTVMAIDYFEQHCTKVLGALWNRVPRKVSYHTFESCRKYVQKFFEMNMPSFGVYGHVPILTDEEGNEQDGSGCKVSCALRKPSKQSLAMSDDDVDKCLRMCKLMIDHVDHIKLFRDIFNHFGGSLPPGYIDPKGLQIVESESSNLLATKRGSTLADFASPELSKRLRRIEIGGLIMIPPRNPPNPHINGTFENDTTKEIDMNDLAARGGLRHIPPAAHKTAAM